MSRRTPRDESDSAYRLFVVEALADIIENQEAIMSAQDNLAAAVAGLADNFGKLDAAVQAGIAEIKAAVSANDDAAIQAAADKIGVVSAAMAADAAALAAAGQPAPAPAPQPDPAPVAQPDPQPAPVAAPAAAPAADAPAAS